MIESPSSPRPITSLHWLAEERGLESTRQTGQGRMRCPHYYDAHKPKSQFAEPANVSQGLRHCHICINLGNTKILTKYHHMNYSSIFRKSLVVKSTQSKQNQQHFSVNRKEVL